jgi:hypothetical protein
MPDLPQLYGLMDYSMIYIMCWLLWNYNFFLPHVYNDYWYWNVGWNMIIWDWKYGMWFDEWDVDLRYKYWWYSSLYDKVVRTPACIIDGVLKEYLRSTRGDYFTHGYFSSLG